jgi:hypothetical protein
VIAALRDALEHWARGDDDDVCLLAARARNGGFSSTVGYEAPEWSRT